MRTTSGQKNPHEDDSVVSPAVDKDAIPVDDEEREVVDQPSKSLPILISGSTHAETLAPPHEDTAVETAADDEGDIDFGDLDAFDEILSASFAVGMEIPTVSGSEVQRLSGRHSPTPTHITPSTSIPPVEMPTNLLTTISTLLNQPLDSLAADGDAKQFLLESISSLSKAALPSSVRPFYQSLCRFTEDLLEKVPKVDAAKASFSQAAQQLEAFDKELEKSLKAKDLASTKLAAGESRAQEMTQEINQVEERLKVLKAKKQTLDQAVGKLRLDIVKAENRLSNKQSQRQAKSSLVEEARKSLEDVQAAKDGVAKQQEELKLVVRGFLA